MAHGRVGSGGNCCKQRSCLQRRTLISAQLRLRLRQLLLRLQRRRGSLSLRVR